VNWRARWALAWVFVFAFSIPCAAAEPGFVVSPATIELKGNYERAQIVLTPAGNSGSVQAGARYLSTDPKIVAVSASGLVRALRNGHAEIQITVGRETQTIPVQVSGVVANPAIDFVHDVLPVISKAGCNAGACHASQFGKGGFKLSVFAFAPDEDYRAMVRDGFGRRVDTVQPNESLILLKPTLHVPHEGGHRLFEGTVDFQILRQWIAQGAKPPSLHPNKTVALQVFPSRCVGPVGLKQQLRVEAVYSDGSHRDVTALARFHSMDEGVFEIGREGLISTLGKGQGVALAQFEDQATIAAIVVPYSARADLAAWKDQNFVDHLAAAKFRELGITPSHLCDDATFLRRASLDVLGTLPSVAEARAFLNDRDPDKRKKLIDRILGLTGDPSLDVHNEQYAGFWTLKWSDLIRSNSATIGEQGMWALYNWLKESFRENKPFDQFVRELITAQGSTFSNGPANYYRIAANPQDLAEETSQLFLGVRLGCAKCHHHPYEKISQADYYGFAAFFARVGSKQSQDFGLFGNETVVLLRPGGEVRLPKTGKVAPPTPLFDGPVSEGPDRRVALADWMCSPHNRFFARNIVNRYMDYLMGRGLVDPVDDMRDTNAPSNPALLDALADEFTKSGFNIKHLLQTIMNSRLYQLDSQPTPANRADDRFYSYFHPKRVAAEALLDAIDQATGVPTKFTKVPLGTRAIDLPDAQYNNYFLKTFGKPGRQGVCECERVSEPNLAQALDTLNGDIVTAKVANPNGRIAHLLKAKQSAQEIVEELYLAALGRLPTPEEKSACTKLRAEASNPKAFYEDLLWSLINSKQFLFIH
jgi:hypothetical protein